MMFFLCYAQCPSYLLPMVFLALSILQHYIKFDSCTMVTMEKLLGMGSFGITMGHLACC